MNYPDAIERGGMEPDDAGSGLMRSINLRDLWAPIYRSRFSIIGIFVLVFSVAVVATLFIRPLFSAAATVEIKQEIQKVLGTEDRSEQISSPTDADRFLDTQLDIIRSRATTVAVAQSLGLYNGDRFLQAMGINPDAGKPGILNAQEAHREVVNDTLLRHLDASLSDETRIAQIEFTGPDPRLVARIANSYAENYIRLNLARRADASSYSLDFLRDQLREAQARLGESERAALAYARRTRLVDASNAATGSGQSGGPQSLTTASLVTLNQALSEATTKRIAAEQQWNQARSAPLLSVPVVAANSAVQQLQQQRALLQGQYEEELQTRRENYPTVRQLQARIAELGQQIDKLGTSVRGTVREEYQAALAEEQALRRNFESLKGTTLDEQNRSIQLSILQREADTNRAQLDALLTRYNDLNAQSGVQLNNLAIIDRAEVPTSPYWPSLPLNLALALITSLLLSAGFVIGRENLFELVRTPEDVGTRLGVPVLGAIPAETDVLEQLNDPKSAISEAFATIRTSLSLTSSAGVPASFMVTSTQAGEGKSTACYGLARGLARLGRSVVLVDADLRRPNVHRLFDVPNGPGLSTVLAGSGTIDDVIRRDLSPNLDVVLSGPIPPSPGELLASDVLRRIIEELGERYDHVLVDSAPMLGLADAPLVATRVAGTLFVIEAARTNVKGAQNAVNRLRQTGTPIIGALLSRFDPGKSGYAYEYLYAYDYSYNSTKAST